MANYNLLPVSFVKENRIILTADGAIYSPFPSDATVLQKLYRLYGQVFRWNQCDTTQFSHKFYEIYDGADASFLVQAENDELDSFIEEDIGNSSLLMNNTDAPVIRLIDSMINDACSLGASDIHIESFRQQVCIRFRIDGFLQDMVSHDIRLAAPLISRLKIMSGLDIAERRLPQDGRMLFPGFNTDIDIRISVIPVSAGERVVLRILSKDGSRLSLSSFNLSPDMLGAVRQLILQPHGMMLVTGPTGSGKSTSLYAFLNEIRSPEKNILTIEDPIEYQLENVGQVQVNVQNGLSFSRGLRALLRQDPDVVMIGEIRDQETATIAVQAALTGHFVFSTLHTNSATGAITRLRDMGVESYLIASVLSGVMAQRLVRVLCSECKVKNHPPEAMARAYGLSATEYVWEEAGCAHCKFKGYLGRTGIYELLIIDDTMRDMIHGNAPEKTIAEYLKLRTKTILQDGLEKVRCGITSLSELVRVTTQL